MIKEMIPVVPGNFMITNLNFSVPIMFSLLHLLMNTIFTLLQSTVVYEISFIEILS